MTEKNKNKFKALVSPDNEHTADLIRERNRNRKQIRTKQKIGLNILKQLDILGWSQRRLAEEIGVSPQQVNKWVKGTENYTIDTLIRIGDILDIELITVKPLHSPEVIIKRIFEELLLEKLFVPRKETAPVVFKNTGSETAAYGRMHIIKPAA